MAPFPQGLTGWLDYDRSKLAGLTPSERIDYFERRVDRVFIRPLNELMAKTATEGPDSTSLLIVGMTACCGIEALGKFVGGSAMGNGKRFEEFAKTYLSADLQGLGPIGTRMDSLWKHFRNGLAHGFAVSHGGFEGDDKTYFSTKNYTGYDVLEVSPGRLVADITKGFNGFVADLRHDCPHGRFLIFNAEFTSVFINGN